MLIHLQTANVSTVQILATDQLSMWSENSPETPLSPLMSLQSLSIPISSLCVYKAHSWRGMNVNDFVQAETF